VPVNLSILGSYKNDCDRLRPDGEDDYKIDSCGNLNLDRIPSAVIPVNPAALTEYEEEEDEDAPEQKDRENFTDDTNYCYFDAGLGGDYMLLKWFHCERKSPPIPCAQGTAPENCDTREISLWDDGKDIDLTGATAAAAAAANSPPAGATQE